MKTETYYQLLVQQAKRETLTFDNRDSAIAWLNRFFPNLTIHQDATPAADGWLSVWSRNIVPADPDAVPLVYGMGISFDVYSAEDI